MTLNLIEEKQIVRNIVELQPHRTYIHASAECSDLKSLGISAAGTYGEVSASNRGVANKNYLLDFNRFSDYQNNSSLSSRKSSLEALNSQNDDRSSVEFEEEINNIGIFKDKTSQFKFGIEKVEQKYLVDDIGFYKKKSIKNLYKFYRENMRHRVFNPRWGFSNYNCLNFFNINNAKVQDKSHQNCLAYPNPYENSKNTYRFWDNDKLTISFYINQNNKNIEGYHFNPGCVLFVPGIIGIYIVKGSSVDESGLTDAYRILVVYGDDLDAKSKIIDFVNSNIDNSEEVALNDPAIKDVSFYLSPDNILKYNNWQNITIVANKKSMSLEAGSKNIINTKIYIDGTINSRNASSHHYPTAVGGASTFFSLKQEVNSFILIGNRYETVLNEKEDIFNKLFSNNKDAVDDYVGPYVNKYISFGKTLKDNYFVNEVTANEYSIKNSLDLNTGTYVIDSGFGLTAEIHDIRIYNSIVGDIKKEICKNSLKNFDDENLEFAVPVLCYEEKIKKKGIVNLKGISNNNNTTNNLSNIDLNNIVLSSPINHYFSNKCLGHEVNVECFTSEFKNRVFPNCIFNDSIDSDQETYNLFNCILNSSNEEDLNEVIRKGKSVNKILYKFIANKENSLYNSIYYKRSLLYRNNFIMPCDNGLQKQEYKNYYESNNIDLHTDNGLFDIMHVSLNKTFSKEDIFISNNIISYCGDQDLIDYTNELGFIKSLEERRDFWIIQENSKKFKTSYDVLKNASLNNYYRNSFHIVNNTALGFKVYKNLLDNDTDFSLLDVGRNSFLKDLSNPVCRKINDDYTPSVANHLAPFETKEVDLEEPRNYVSYFKHEMPIYNLFDSNSENFSKSFCVSTQMFGRRIEKESLEMYDPDLAGTFGCKKVRLRDDGKGTVYRADAYTKHADWNYVGHCFYNEGIVNILHPSLENFGDFSIKVDFDASTKLNVLELNLPAYAGKTNKSRNDSYINDLRLNESAFNSDEDFVYISDINLHDENLNILAKAKIVKPHAKKDSDNVLFRLKMDY